MKLSVSLAALLSVATIGYAAAQSPPPPATNTPSAEQGAEHPPTGRVGAAVPEMKGNTQAEHPPTGRIGEVVPPMKPGDQPSSGPVTTNPGVSGNESAAGDKAATANPGAAQPGTFGFKGFTEEQARMHLAKSGYTNISHLTKDADGVWRGTAMKDGKEVGVAIDIKGGVTPQ